ncbi:MAG: hypothetical protein AB3N15_02305 [Paracoccaceae bacterium]
MNQESTTTTHIQDAKLRIAAANRWIFGFFFVLLVTWLPNFVIDVSAGENGLTEARVIAAIDAADRAHTACSNTSKLGNEKCESRAKELEESLSALNNDLDFVVFKIGSVGLRYQVLFIVFIGGGLLFYIEHSRRRVSLSLVRAVSSLRLEDSANVPPAYILDSPPPWLWPLPRTDDKEVHERHLKEMLGLSGSHFWNLTVGIGIRVLLFGMVVHAFYIHTTYADKVVGRANFSDGETRYDGLSGVDDELPYSMAFTGDFWLDFAILAIGIIVACAMINYSITSQISVGMSSGDNESSVGMLLTRRTVGFSLIALSFPLADSLGSSTRAIARKLSIVNNPRRVNKGPRVFIDLAEGWYAKEAQGKERATRDSQGFVRSGVIHFVDTDRHNGKTYLVASPPIAISRLRRIEPSTALLQDSLAKINSNCRAKAVEWAALERLKQRDIAAEPDWRGALRFLVAELEIITAEAPKSKSVPNIRLFDLAAGLAVRYDDDLHLSRILLLAQTTAQNSRIERIQKRLRQRLDRWSDTTGSWQNKWRENPREWNFVELPDV